jgi:hypothetical protein
LTGGAGVDLPLSNLLSFIGLILLPVSLLLGADFLASSSDVTFSITGAGVALVCSCNDEG